MISVLKLTSFQNIYSKSYLDCCSKNPPGDDGDLTLVKYCTFLDGLKFFMNIVIVINFIFWWFLKAHKEQNNYIIV